jgi:hypothetical protein
MATVLQMICPTAEAEYFARSTGHREVRDEADLPDGQGSPNPKMSPSIASLAPDMDLTLLERE